MAKKSGKNKGYSYRINKNKGEKTTVTCRKYFLMPNGKREQLSATGKTEEEARKKLDEKYAEIYKQGKRIKSNGFTVKSWCEYWLFDIKKTELKGHTFDGYYKAFENDIFPVIGKNKLKDLCLTDVQKVVTKISNRAYVKNGKKQKISGKTVKEYISPLIQALNYAMDDGKMPYISFKRLQKPKVKKGTREIRPKEEQEIVTKYFMNEITDEPFKLYYAPIAVMDARGLRPEECGGLQWQDIDYENNTFWVGRHTVVKNGIYDENHKKIGEHIVVVDSAKTDSSERKLPLGNFLSNLFKKKHQEYIDKGIVPKPTDFIFITKAGNPYYEQSLRKMYKSLAKRLGISEIGCYSLRHEFATFLSQVENADQETIKQLMGWSEMVDTYFHTDDKTKQKAVEKIDNQFTNNNVENGGGNVEAKDDDIQKSNRKDNVIYFDFKNAINQ